MQTTIGQRGEPRIRVELSERCLSFVSLDGGDLESLERRLMDLGFRPERAAHDCVVLRTSGPGDTADVWGCIGEAARQPHSGLRFTAVVYTSKPRHAPRPSGSLAEVSFL